MSYADIFGHSFVHSCMHPSTHLCILSSIICPVVLPPICLLSVCWFSPSSAYFSSLPSLLRNLFLVQVLGPWKLENLHYGSISPVNTLFSLLPFGDWTLKRGEVGRAARSPHPTLALGAEGGNQKVSKTRAEALVPGVPGGHGAVLPIVSPWPPLLLPGVTHRSWEGPVPLTPTLSCPYHQLPILDHTTT